MGVASSQWARKKDTLMETDGQWAAIRIEKQNKENRNHRKQWGKEFEAVAAAAATWPSVHHSCQSERMRREKSSLVLAMEKVMTFKRTLIPEH